MSTFIRSATFVMDMKGEDKEMYEAAVVLDDQTEAPPSPSCEYDDSDYCESEEEENPYETELRITYPQYENLVKYFISEIFNLLDENIDGKLSKGEDIPAQFSKVDVMLKLTKTMFMIGDTNRDYKIGFEDIFAPAIDYEEYGEDEDDGVDTNTIKAFTGHQLSSFPDWAQLIISNLDTDENEKLHWSEVKNFVRTIFQFFNSEEGDSCQVDYLGIEKKLKSLDFSEKNLVVVRSAIGFYTPAIEHLTSLMIKVADVDGDSKISTAELFNWSDRTSFVEFFKLFFEEPKLLWRTLLAPWNMDPADVSESLSRFLDKAPVFGHTAGRCFTD